MNLLKVKKNNEVKHRGKAGVTLSTVLLAAALLLRSGQASPDDVIPSPRKIILQDGALRVPKTVSVGVSTGQQHAERLTRLLNEYLQEEGYTALAAGNREALITVQVGATSAAGFYETDESYQLRITRKGAMITAGAPRGAFYGLMTFVQLLSQYRREGIPCMLIEDSPTLAMRGISDDVSRGQVQQPAELQRTLRWLARYKMNTYMPYLEDMLQLPGYPAIGNGRGAWSQDELREITAFAEDHFINVIPIFQTLGHYENILSKPQFQPWAEFPGAASLSFTSAGAQRFLEDALGYVCQNFPGEYVHIGADESYDAGLYRSKGLVDSIGIERAYARHYEFVTGILAKYGKKAIMYGDMLSNHPGILPLLPKAMTVMSWSYRAEPGYAQVKTVASYNLQQITSPSVWNFTSTYPVQGQMFPNTLVMAREARDNGAIGMVTSNWGDYGAETPKEFLFPGYAWSAQCSWTYEKANEGGFTQRFIADYWGMDGARYEPVLLLLGNTNNQLVWHEFWRHPGLGQREPGWFEARISSTAKSSALQAAQQVIERFAKDVSTLARRNRQSGAAYSVLAEIYAAYIKKQAVSSRLADFATGSGDANAFAATTGEAKEALQRAERAFTAQWNATNKRENLNLIQEKFARLSAYLAETEDAVAGGNKDVGKKDFWLLPSEWLYPAAYDTNRNEPVTFTATFTLLQAPTAAHLQVLANTHGEISVNGSTIGEVYVKRSLSLYTEDERVFTRDIAGYLRGGENQIRITVRNYYPNAVPGVNVYLRCRANKTQTDYFSGKGTAVEWTAVCNSRETGTTVKKYPFDITAPYPETERKSRIER